MDDKTRRMVYNEIKNPWEFVNKAAEKYKDEFKRTRLIKPPKIDDVIAKTIADELGIEIEGIESPERAVVAEKINADLEES